MLTSNLSRDLKLFAIFLVVVFVSPYMTTDEISQSFSWAYMLTPVHFTNQGTSILAFQESLTCAQRTKDKI